jgi:NADH dehydrogenase FAD-containing subunit
VGQSTVFALGDLSTADAKMAGFARHEAETVAANIASLAGRSDLSAYQPMGPGIVVPIGPNGGAGQFPGQDEIVGPDLVADVKGRDMMVDPLQELFGLAVAAAD